MVSEHKMVSSNALDKDVGGGEKQWILHTFTKGSECLAFVPPTASQRAGTFTRGELTSMKDRTGIKEVIKKTRKN